MITRPIIRNRAVSALVIVCVMTAFYAQPAAAQTASKLDCNGCITSKHIKSKGVKSGDLKNRAVTNGKLANGAVNSAKVKDDSLTASDLAPNAVGRAEIQTGAVAADEIAAGAVGSSEVATDAIAATDLSNEAGANFSDAQGSLTIGTAGKPVLAVAVTAPSSGKVILTSSGTWFTSAAAQRGQCSLTENSTAVDIPNIQETALSVFFTGWVPFALTRGFTVPSAGTRTYRLVCRTTAGSAAVINPHLTAMFFPTAY